MNKKELMYKLGIRSYKTLHKWLTVIQKDLDIKDLNKVSLFSSKQCCIIFEHYGTFEHSK